MQKSFGQLAVEYAGRFEDPDKPEKSHQFEEPAQLARCIDLLLPTAQDEELLADLPRRLQECATTFADGNLQIDAVRRAVDDLSECFENYLQLIAQLKYSGKTDLLFGNEVHRGLMHTSLGGLLHGHPDLKPGAAGERIIPKARLVTYDGRGRGRRDRIYRATKRIRNRVHLAQVLQPLQVLRDSKVVLAAYLFATEENVKLISHSLHEHRRYLTALLARLQSTLPSVIEPELEDEAGEHQDKEPSESQSVRRSITDFKNHAVDDRSHMRFAVYGDPGAGKTTLVFELARRLVQEKRRAPLGDVPLPVLVEANRYTDNISFAELIASELAIRAGDLSDFTKHNPVVVLIDGLNEIPAQFLRTAKAELRHLSTRLSDAGFVLTSRFPAVFRLLGFRSFRLVPFDDDRVKQFVGRELKGERGSEFVRELQRLPRLLELCRNPLLLHMLVELSSEEVAIPKNRGKLLHEFMTRFLVREEPQITPVSVRTMRLLLSRLAFEMRSKKVVSLSVMEVERYVTELARELQAGVGAVDVLSAILGAKLLHHVGDDRVAFFHELIQEYFAALELLGQLKSGRAELEAFVADRWWREVVVLAYGLEDGHPDLFSSLAQSDLALLAQGVMDGPQPDKERQEEVVERAATVIESGISGQAMAFGALAVVWNDEALRRVAGALRSGSQVTDFVERFARDPYGAALDLLNTRATGAIVTGIALALQRTPRAATREQRSQLFSTATRLIVKKADGEVPEASYKSLGQIALLGKVGEERTLLEEGISALLDVNEIEWADRLAARFMSDEGLSERLSKRLATKLVMSAVPLRYLSLERLKLAEPDCRELLEVALLRGAYDWAITLSRWVDSHDCLVVSLGPLARQLLRTSTGKKTGKILQAIGGRDAAERLLRAMLLDLEIPPALVGQVTSWLGDSGPVRRRMSEYIGLALRQRLEPQCYADIVRWAGAGDLSTEVACRLLDLLLEEKDYESSLLVLHGAGLRSQYSGLILEAERALDPESVAQRSSSWVDVVYNRFWLDWSPQFQSRLIDYAATNAADMNSRTWSPKAVERLRAKLRIELGRLEGVVPRDACELAGIGEEAARIVVDRIADVVQRDDLELAFGMAAEWAVGIRDLHLKSELEEVMHEAAGAKALALARADKIHQAFNICQTWGVDPREALSEILTLSSGNTSSAAVAAGFDHGVFHLPDVEAWFLERLRSGDIGKALGLRRSAALRGDLNGSAILGSLELFRYSRFKEAGQVISAFDLQEDFGPELEEIVPHLIAEGKPGTAHQLVQALGPRYSAAFADLVLGAAREQLQRGEISKALGLVDHAAMGLVRDEFGKSLTEYLVNAVDGGRREDVRRIVEIPAASSLLTSKELVIRALEVSSAKVHAVVRRVVSDRGYCFARLATAEVDVFLHRSVMQGGGIPETGTRLLISVADHPKGPRATWAAIVHRDDTASQRKASAHRKDAGSLRELTDAWGARLRKSSSPAS